MREKLGLNGSQLKWIAIISMLFDHSAKIIRFYFIPGTAVSYESLAGLYSNYETIRTIFLQLGRLAFPIFCFLLVEGFLHTSNVKKYGMRLFLFALVSEVPFDLAFFGQPFYFNYQNVFFTLFIGLLTIAGMQKLRDMGKNSIPLDILIGLAGIIVAELLHTDYGGKIGVLLIICLYYFKDHPLLKCLLGALVILQNSIASNLYLGLVSFVFIYLYNGKRGRQWKYFFYAFYPVHLLLLVALQRYMVIPYFEELFQVIIQ